MTRLLQRIRAYLPQRRRRRWRYVSGRRTRRGVALMTLVVLTVAGWWYVTNDGRIRRKAVAYLEQLTGVDVRIQDASFSLMGGIRLRGVRVFDQAQRPAEDILRAREVRLKYEPLSLLRPGRLVVTDIVCVEPTVTITEDVDRGVWNVEPLFHQTDLADSALDIDRLPAVRIRDGRIVRQEILRGALIPLCVERLSARAIPIEGTRHYRIEVQGDESAEAVRAVATLSLDPIGFAWEGGVPVGLLGRTLPHGYRTWWETYNVDGMFRFEGNLGGAEQDRLVLSLDSASMTLPPLDGGLVLADLSGEIELTGDGVRVMDVTGRLPGLGGAPVGVSGRFDGYEGTSPLVLTIDIERLVFPLEFAAGQLGRILEIIRGFDPVGPMGVTVQLRRDRGGEVEHRVTVRPLGMEATTALFPLPVTDLRGEVVFDAERVSLVGLTGRSGDADVTVTGTVSIREDRKLDIHVLGRNMSLGEPMRAVLAASSVGELRGAVRQQYDRFNLEGGCDVAVHVFTDATGSVRAEADLRFDGKAAGTFDGFPYRLEGLAGTVAIRPGEVTIDALQAERGSGTFHFNGTVVSRKPGAGFMLEITATDVGLDTSLAEAITALHPDFGALYDAFALTGAVDISGALTQQSDGPIQYDLLATAEDAAMRYAQFPYDVEGISAGLRFTPEGVEVRRVVGRHGDGRVELSGRVGLESGDVIPELTIEAHNVRFDDEMRCAVETASAQAAAVWDHLQPAGSADILYHTAPGEGGASLQIVAQDMAITPRSFPYLLDHLRGTVLVFTDEPWRIELHNVTGGTEAAPMSFSGMIGIQNGRLESARLELNAAGLPIDAGLLDAAPPALEFVTTLLRPGGRCDINLSRLEYRGSPPLSPEPAAAGAEPASRPVSWRWAVDGDVRFHDAAFQVVVPVTGVDGSIGGSVLVGEGDKSLSIDIKVDADTLKLWGRHAAGLKGAIQKQADEPRLRVVELSTDFCGGRLGGNIMVELGDPYRYTAALIMEDADLAELLGAGGEDGREGATASGKLSGRLDLNETVGRPDRREGRGRFRIVEARIGKVPVLLGLMNVVFLQLPNESAFSTGDLEYHIKGSRLVFDRLHLEGTTRSVVGLHGAPSTVVGRGEVDIQTEQINLVFRSGPPSVLRGLLFGQLWEVTAEGLYNTHITGHWRSPKVQPVLLEQLDRLLGEIGGVE